jgi:hypothetical protein
MLKHFLFLFLVLFALAAHAGRFLPQNAQVGQINGHNYKVFYQLDPGGLLIQMWLPTPEEEAGMNR